MESSSLVETQFDGNGDGSSYFREGSVIFTPETADYEAAFGILYKRHTIDWYVFWSDTGYNHHEHDGLSEAGCVTNFADGAWKLICY